MNKPEYIKKIGRLNTEPYINFIKSNSIIFERDERKNRDILFGNAKTFFLVNEFKGSNLAALKDFGSVAKDLFKTLEYWYGPGTIYNIQFSMLSPGNKIKRHYDQGLHFSLSQRIHVPLITCKDVVFHINNRQFNFDAGLIVEINNNQYHAVENNSQNTERVHLIIDYVPRKYVKYIYSP
jgi:hypothetical protein